MNLDHILYQLDTLRQYSSDTWMKTLRKLSSDEVMLWNTMTVFHWIDFGDHLTNQLKKTINERILP
jgi:hypothetical protein